MSAPAIPPRPIEPQPYECCNRGCCPCIMDYYADALDRWHAAVRAMGIDPETLAT
jgi:hypothetical protein